MAIEVKHGARPGAALFARFGGAEGQAWRRALEGFLRARERLSSQAREEDFRREMTGIAHEQDLEKLAITQDYRAAIYDRQGQYDLERQRIRNIGRQQEIAERFDYERGLVDYQLTAEQRDRESKIRQALSVIEHDETLTPEDRYEARRQLAYQLADITPVPKRKEPLPDIREAIQYHEGLQGYVYMDPKTGKLQELGIRGADKGISEADAWKLALSTTKTEEGIDVEAARRLVGDIMAGADIATDQISGAEKTPDPDRQIQMMEDRLKEIEGYPDQVKRDIRAYGGVTKIKEPGEIESIAEIEAHIMSLQEDLGAHRRKYMKKIPEGATDEELGISLTNVVYTTKENELMKEMHVYQQRLEAKKKEWKQNLIYYHMARANKAISGR